MDAAKHAAEPKAGQSPASGQPSAGMQLELQTNQAVLDGLVNWYSVFAFTGGAVPSGHCQLAAVNSYLARPFAAECILTKDVERYRCLIESIMMPKAGIPARPRTLRGRKLLADAFGRTAAEIRALGSSLQSALRTPGQTGA